MTTSSRHLPTLVLDARLGTPAYLQIFRQIQRQVAARRLHPGDQLPTVRQLAAQLGINFNTAARAYRMLQRAGVVSAQQGRGTFVLEHGSATRTGVVTLQALTSHYIKEAKRYEFDAAEITGMVARLLRS